MHSGVVMFLLELGPIQLLNLFMPKGISLSFQLDEFISNFRVVGWYFHFSQMLKETSVSKRWRT